MIYIYSYLAVYNQAFAPLGQPCWQGHHSVSFHFAESHFIEQFQPAATTVCCSEMYWNVAETMKGIKDTAKSWTKRKSVLEYFFQLNNKPAHFYEHAVLICEVYFYGSRCCGAPGYTSTRLAFNLPDLWSWGTERVKRLCYLTCVSAASNKNGANVGPPENTAGVQQLKCFSAVVIKLVQSYWNSFQLAFANMRLGWRCWFTTFRTSSVCLFVYDECSTKKATEQIL